MKINNHYHFIALAILSFSGLWSHSPGILAQGQHQMKRASTEASLKKEAEGDAPQTTTGPATTQKAAAPKAAEDDGNKNKSQPQSSPRAHSQEPLLSGKIIYIDALYYYVVIDKGLEDGVEIGAQVCLYPKKPSPPLTCSDVVAAIKSVAAIYIPPEILAKIEKGTTFKVTARPKKPKPKYSDKYIYAEDEGEDAKLYERYQDPKDQPDDKESFFITEEEREIQKGQKTPQIGGVAKIKNSISAGYLYTLVSPTVYNSLFFHPPSYNGGTNPQTTRHIWDDQGETGTSKVGFYGKYTTSKIGPFNYAISLYYRYFFELLDEQNYIPTDPENSYVETTQTAHSLGLALDALRFLGLGRKFGLKYGLGLGIERSYVKFSAKAYGGSSGRDIDFANYKSTLYLLLLRVPLAINFYLKPHFYLSLIFNPQLPVLHSGKSSANSEVPNATDITYASDVNNDLEVLINHKKNKYGMDLMLEFTLNLPN